MELETLICETSRKEEIPQGPPGRIQHPDNGVFADLVQILQDLFPANKTGLPMSCFSEPGNESLH